MTALTVVLSVLVPLLIVTNLRRQTLRLLAQRQHAQLVADFNSAQGALAEARRVIVNVRNKLAVEEDEQFVSKW